MTDTPLARALCPELIVAEKYTDRARYLCLMRRSDICIGSTGLWDLIGWKTGEYVAAARAIVNERFVYEVPGDFRELPGLCLGRGVRGAGRFADALSRRRAAHEGGQCGLLP